MRNHLTAYSDAQFKNRAFTYDGAHVYLTYYPYYAYQSAAEASGFYWRDRAYTLVLSQPATQGRQGGSGVLSAGMTGIPSLYYEFPYVPGQSAAEYYASQQAAADAGKDTTLLDPVSAALEFVKTRFNHQLATCGQLRSGERQTRGRLVTDSGAPH